MFRDIRDRLRKRYETIPRPIKQHKEIVGSVKKTLNRKTSNRENLRNAINSSVQNVRTLVKERLTNPRTYSSVNASNSPSPFSSASSFATFSSRHLTNSSGSLSGGNNPIQTIDRITDNRQLTQQPRNLRTSIMDLIHYLTSFIPEQETLHTIFTVLKWEEWKKSSWKKKSNLLAFYIILLGGSFYFVYNYWKAKQSKKLKPWEPSDDHYDVCIVGGGPAGTACAYYLTRLGGKRVLVLERDQYPRNKCCAGVLTPKAQQHLTRMGVFQEILDEEGAHWLNCGGFVSPAGESFISGAVEILQGKRVVAVQRSLLDYKMALAVSREGAVVMDNSKVTDVQFIAETGLWNVFCIQNGVEVCHSARMLVGADGAKSSIARKLSIVKSPPNASGSCIVADSNNGSLLLKADGCIFFPPKIKGNVRILLHGETCQWYLPSLCCYK